MSDNREEGDKNEVPRHPLNPQEEDFKKKRLHDFEDNEYGEEPAIKKEYVAG